MGKRYCLLTKIKSIQVRGINISDSLKVYILKHLIMACLKNVCLTNNEVNLGKTQVEFYSLSQQLHI